MKRAGMKEIAWRLLVIALFAALGARISERAAQRFPAAKTAPAGN